MGVTQKVFSGSVQIPSGGSPSPSPNPSLFSLPDFAALSAVDAEVQDEFVVAGRAAADDQCKLGSGRARRQLLLLVMMLVGLDVEFEDETERRRAQTDDGLRVSRQLRRRVVQQQNYIAHTHTHT